MLFDSKALVTSNRTDSIFQSIIFEREGDMRTSLIMYPYVSYSANSSQLYVYDKSTTLQLEIYF